MEALEKYFWGRSPWMMNNKIDRGSAQTFGIVQINAVQKNAVHSHPDWEQILYVLSGSCEHRIDDKKVTLCARDLIGVATAVKHQPTMPANKALRAVILYSSGEEQVSNYGPAAE